MGHLSCIGFISAVTPTPRKRLRSNPDLKNSIGRKRKLCFKGSQYMQAPSTDRVVNARRRSEAENNNPRLKAASRRKILPLSDEQSQAGSAQFRLVDFSLLLPFLHENLRFVIERRHRTRERQNGQMGEDRSGIQDKVQRVSISVYQRDKAPAPSPHK
uniref:Uncharacterized protein n=1 Tax=Trichogramma kaykai TaxID=54128 RepID=A0ABD2XQQ7_9HYME